MGKKFLSIVLLCFLIFNMGINAYGTEGEETAEADQTINIVVIHSYNMEYEWTYNENEGLKTELSGTYPNANVFTEFLDWKRFPNETLLFDKAQEFRDKYKNMKIDLLLVTDDKGLEFAIQYRKEIFQDAPIVFGGVLEASANKIIGDETNITGVYEKMKPEGVIELLKILQPEVDHLVLLHDLSESGIETNTLFLEALKTAGVEEDYQISDWSERTADEISDDIGYLDKNTAVILYSYAISSDGTIKTARIFGEMFSASSSVPIYSMSEHQFGYGILGGTFLSGVLQGNEMGRLAIQILNGESADTIPYVSEATVYTGVDETYIKKYGLDKRLLPSDVTIINEEETFYEKHQILVNVTLAVLGLLLLFIFVLLWFQIRLHRSREQILVSNKKLQVLNEELQENKEELIAQKEELEKIKENLEYENEHDYLTGLYNRSALQIYLTNVLKQMKETSKMVIVFIDIDNFKFINNTYGHHFGDELLIKVGKRLEIIDEEMYVSRIGGDEFVLVKHYPNAEDSENLKSILLRIAKSLLKDFIIEGNKISVTASIGYSLAPDNGTSYEQLLIEADMAMYHAKKAGKSALKKYVKGMNDIYQNEYLMTNKIKEALEMDEFFLQYQPIVKSDGSMVTSFEVLLRWNNKEMGNVPPAKFIPVAESSGLILPIGKIIFQKAFEFYHRMCEEGIRNIKLSINVSIVQFYQDSFLEDLVTMVQLYDMEPRYVQLEITESIMIEAYEYIIEKMKELKNIGFRIALDDFGTGYSSLSYLQKLPIDVLKIDKSFTDQIEDTQESILVDATVSLAKRFGLQIVAEGVETKEQVQYLLHRDCEYIQGYYYSKPLDEEGALAFARDRNMNKE